MNIMIHLISLIFPCMRAKVTQKVHIVQLFSYFVYATVIVCICAGCAYSAVPSVINFGLYMPAQCPIGSWPTWALTKM